MSDERAIEQVVLDYFESWYDGDAARMERALHPALAKRALGGDSGVDHTTAREMVEATARGVGKRRGAADRSVEVRIEDVNGTMANVTAVAAAYHEYIQLLRTQDGWKIVNCLWQLRESAER